MRLDSLKGLAPALAPALARVARSVGVTMDRASATPEPPAPAEAPLRGSGSWANDWAEDFKADWSPLAKAAGLTPPAPEAPLAETGAAAGGATLRAKALLDPATKRMHDWLVDRLEEEAPLHAIHAKVALDAFVGPEAGDAPELERLTVDLLIVDEAGRPTVAFMRRGVRRAGDEAVLSDALREAGVAVIAIAPRVQASKVWGAVSGALGLARASEPADPALA